MPRGRREFGISTSVQGCYDCRFIVCVGGNIHQSKVSVIDGESGRLCVGRVVTFFCGEQSGLQKIFTIVKVGKQCELKRPVLLEGHTYESSIDRPIESRQKRAIHGLSTQTK